MKKLFLGLSLFSVFTICCGQDFKIPERTLEQKHDRVVYLAYANIIGGIAYAKSANVSVKDYSSYVGDNFKNSWDKESGFAGFTQGVINNFENSRKEQDPPMQIWMQSPSKVVFTCKINYKSLFDEGPVSGVTYEELTLWLDIVYRKIGDYLGAVYTQEVIEGDWLRFTITKKQ